MPSSFTCNDCGTSGSEQWMRTHDCQSVQDVRQFGGRCEDYPCCGHQLGECEPQESFTKEYWLTHRDPDDPDAYQDYGEEPECMVCGEETNYGSTIVNGQELWYCETHEPVR